MNLPVPLSEERLLDIKRGASVNWIMNLDTVVDLQVAGGVGFLVGKETLKHIITNVVKFSLLNATTQLRLQINWLRRVSKIKWIHALLLKQSVFNAIYSHSLFPFFPCDRVSHLHYLILYAL